MIQLEQYWGPEVAHAQLHCILVRLQYGIRKYTCNKYREVGVNWASEVSPTMGCSIEISRDILIIQPFRVEYRYNYIVPKVGIFPQAGGRENILYRAYNICRYFTRKDFEYLVYYIGYSLRGTTVSVATYPLTMRSIRGGTLGWNIEIYSTPMNQFDWSVSRAYVINTKYSTLLRGISVYIEPKVGIFSEAEIFSTEGAIYAEISQGRVLNI